LEYHILVRPPIPASVALFSLSLLALPLLFVSNGQAQTMVSNGQAQTNGTPTSVTSQGFGGAHPITAPFPVGGTLPGHQVPRDWPSVTFSTSNPNFGDGHPHHRHHSDGRPLVYAYPVPYAVDLGTSQDEPSDNSDAAADDRDADYRGGPTIFDRRGSGADSYVPPATSGPAHRSSETHRSPAQAEADPPIPEPALEPTLLIFKDGHKLEVGNYAIVGATLFDLTPGHSRKVQLADLDVDATRRQNDDRGVTFQIPQLPQAN
jgi:hypothetical protein